MSRPPIVASVSGNTPTRLATKGHVRPLPADLLRGASRRLSILSLVAGALWILGFLLYHVALEALDHNQQGWLFPLQSDAFVVAGASASAALFFYTRRENHDPRRVLDLGQVYLVFTALLLGLMIHWDPVAQHTPISPSISWIGAVVLIFPAIVPSTPLKTAIASIVAVSMNPVGMLITRARGNWDFGHPAMALLMHYPDFLLVGVAVVISHVVTGLGQQVAKARELGSYQLGDLIGRGGMGEVYKATHRMLARPAAIKLIRTEMIGGIGSESARIALKRFRREAEAAANLSSPNTVNLYDFGVTEDQTFYFVMELLDGMTLEALVRRFGPLPPGRVVTIMRQVCESLEEAHAAGLVHRDIKPANIHLGHAGIRHDFVKVLDFGLVKSVAAVDGDDSFATAAGLTPGTPSYMAPEIALGHAVDHHADIYAVGCVGYFLLTGRRVFEGETPLQIIARHLQETPVPPSHLAELPIPDALERLVLQCLAKAPAGRPRDAAEIRRRLDAMDSGAWNEEQALAWWNLNVPGGSAPGVPSEGTGLPDSDELPATKAGPGDSNA